LSELKLDAHSPKRINSRNVLEELRPM